jgi:hypothetical protein
MPESQSRVLKRILGEEPAEKSYTSERQLTAQSFNLHVEKRDGRHAEGFGWSHYFRYRWTDEGTQERLVILMGMAGAVEIEGHNLGLLVNDIRECKLNGVPEMLTAEIELKRANGDQGAIISSVKTYPDFEEILKDIKTR